MVAVVRARPFVVGLTGGIGSGKSTAGAHFANLGAFVVDADQLSHAVTAPGGVALPAIEQAFPGVVHGGVLDRAALRSRVFAAASERARLEAIVHPLVRQATTAVMQTPAAAAAPYVIHMVPLLFEAADFAARIDCAVLVDVDEDTQVARVSATRGVAPDTVRSIIAAQMPRRERLLRTQFVLDNRGEPPALECQVRRLHGVLLANARREMRSAATAATGTAGVAP